MGTLVEGLLESSLAMHRAAEHSLGKGQGQQHREERQFLFAELRCGLFAKFRRVNSWALVLNPAFLVHSFEKAKGRASF